MKSTQVVRRFIDDGSLLLLIRMFNKEKMKTKLTAVARQSAFLSRLIVSIGKDSIFINWKSSYSIIRYL